VLKALAKDPPQRFTNVQEFATALEQAYLLTLPHVSIFPVHSLHHESQHLLSLRRATPGQPMPAASQSTPEPYSELTEREIEVLHLLAGGLTNAQIAEKLIISPRTVHAHVRSIYSKLGVTSRCAATRYAILHQIA
jgi:DNA-binding NarL/FixJ family response regulator